MKSLIIALAFGLSLTIGSAQTAETATFKVYGNCEMCKTRIENAAKVEGVEKATWLQETKILTLVYDSGKIKLEQVHRKIAEAGHDTEKARAADETYQKLPACCKFERPPADEREQE
jgi:mercuric ion binding protein